jgi:hypothetical protein
MGIAKDQSATAHPREQDLKIEVLQPTGSTRTVSLLPVMLFDKEGRQLGQLDAPIFVTDEETRGLLRHIAQRLDEILMKLSE